MLAAHQLPSQHYVDFLYASAALCMAEPWTGRLRACWSAWRRTTEGRLRASSAGGRVAVIQTQILTRKEICAMRWGECGRRICEMGGNVAYLDSTAPMSRGPGWASGAYRPFEPRAHFVPFPMTIIFYRKRASSACGVERPHSSRHPFLYFVAPQVPLPPLHACKSRCSLHDLHRKTTKTRIFMCIHHLLRRHRWLANMVSKLSAKAAAPSSGAVSTYLTIYNIVQFIGWSVPYVIFISRSCAGDLRL